MRRLLCLLMLIGCSESSDLSTMRTALENASENIVAKQDESLGILRENTNALPAIKSQIDTLKAVQVDSETGNGIGGDLESDPSPSVETVVNDSRASSPGMQPVAASAVELFVCSTASCAPCKRMWRDVDDGKLDGFIVSKAPSFDGMKSYPAIRFRDPSSNTGWAVVYGYDEATRQYLRAKLLGEKAVATGGQQPVSGSFFPVSRQTTILNSRSTVRSFSWGSRFVGRSRTTAGKPCPTGCCP